MLTRVADSPSGTLVVWTKLDRVMYKAANTIIKHSSPLVGRIYRNFITDGTVSIHLVRCLDGEPRGLTWYSRNDPLFLTAPSGTPEPFHDTPMFEAYGEPQTIDIEYEEDGTPRQAKSLSAVPTPERKPESRTRTYSHGHQILVTPDAGGTPWGKVADRDRGVSLVRAGREILLDTSWTSSSDPTDRWWSIEVSFDPELDSVFGTVTNKQTATIFARGLVLEQFAPRRKTARMTRLTSFVCGRKVTVEPHCCQSGSTSSANGPDEEPPEGPGEG